MKPGVNPDFEEALRKFMSAPRTPEEIEAWWNYAERMSEPMRVSVSKDGKVVL